jgi:Ras-related GTP-binding protein C/D
LQGTIVLLEMWDCPGNITLDSLGASLSKFYLIIFFVVLFLFICTLFERLASHFLVQDSYQQLIARMLGFFVEAYQENA